MARVHAHLPSLSSDRSKVKGYQKQKDQLSDVAIEISCHSDPKVLEMATEVEGKIAAMDGVIKSFKVVVYKGELELKKDRV